MEKVLVAVCVWMYMRACMLCYSLLVRCACSGILTNVRRSLRENSAQMLSDEWMQLCLCNRCDNGMTSRTPGVHLEGRSCQGKQRSD